MDATAFLALAMVCAPQVDAGTAHALVSVESGFNQHAIGIVGGALVRQPGNRSEALSTARALAAGGWNFSVGLGQINVSNLQRLGLSLERAFEPCSNLAAMQTVLAECLDRATHSGRVSQATVRRALSCYYSGDFVTGFTHGYVHRVATAAARRPSTPVTPKEPS